MKFTKFDSCENLKFLNRGNQIPGYTCKHFLNLIQKKYFNRQNVVLANFAKFNSRKIFEVGVFAKIKKVFLKVFRRNNSLKIVFSRSGDNDLSSSEILITNWLSVVENTIT